ncbi:MAG: transposase [bacterium]|nr:transposase [bacterium]
MGYRETGLGAYMHIYNRGVKKMPIYRNESDLHRLHSLLFYLNHNQPMTDNWIREIEGGLSSLIWPSSWQERVPIVSILAFTIMPNHIHLFLKEIVEGGIAKFMHRVSMAYSKFINKKYEESGSLFEGTYKSRIIHDEADFRNLAAYIMVKNPFELYSGGLTCACREFESAYMEALRNPFTSLRYYDKMQEISPVLDREILGELFSENGSFKDFARECMLHRLDHLVEYDL